MAKGGGGEGHYDERRRAARAARPRTAPTGYADSPEVLSALTRPRSKPLVVVKKKPKVLVPGLAPARKPGLRMGAAQAEVRVGDLSRKRDLGPFDDQIVTSSLKRNRLQDWATNRRKAMQDLDT